MHEVLLVLIIEAAGRDLRNLVIMTTKESNLKLDKDKNDFCLRMSIVECT